GSAAPFVFLIECAGVVSQDAPRKVIRVLKTVTVDDGERAASLTPGNGFSLAFEIDFASTAIRQQAIAVGMADGTFKNEVARARTFGFLHEVEQLWAAGLAKGGSLENAVVVSGDKVLNEDGLRYDDEFVRHKVLDAVGDLYLAGLIPGLLMACLFSLYIYLRCKFDRSLAPNGERARWTQRLRALIHLVPPALLFLLVVGSIYAGLATATEASALGVIGSLVLVIVRGRLNLALLLRSFEGTVRTTAMVMAIVIAAYFLNFVLSTLGLTDAAVKWVGELGWSPIAVLLAIIVLYVFLGCFVESLTLMIATTPIVVPIIVQLGFSPVWFGVVFVILIETALITPPIGMNLFVVQSVRKSGPFRDVVMGSLPFVVLMFLIIVALIVFPDLALWLPSAFAASRA
ncbi:MAG: UDP-3-O-acyl-N-acetylglucosamine deacetylase, partial [Rhodoferax sp.]|nr:UDP-3-O-acyl-N-acetylglucosamine deacetylase [Rhodoferax sp.]